MSGEKYNRAERRAKWKKLKHDSGKVRAKNNEFYQKHPEILQKRIEQSKGKPIGETNE